MMSSFTWGAVLLLCATLLFACTSGDKTFLLQPEGVPAEPTLEQVRPIIDRYCVPCHHSGDGEGEEEEGEEEGELERLDLESCGGLWELRGEVVRVILDKTMPPGAWPRLDDREAYTVLNYFNTVFECPCEDDCP